MSWGSAWNSIRVALMGRINANASIASAANWSLGLCSGTSLGFGSGDSVLNFVGLGSGSPFGTTSWTHSAGTIVPYQSINGYGPVWKHGSTNSGYGANAGLAFPETEAFKLLMVFDVTRPERATAATAVSYAFNVRLGGGIATTAGYQEEKWSMFNQWRDNDQTAIIGSGTLSTNLSSVEESFGAFDAFNFYWQHTTVPFEVAAMGIYKLK